MVFVFFSFFFFVVFERLSGFARGFLESGHDVRRGEEGESEGKRGKERAEGDGGGGLRYPDRRSSSPFRL